MRLLKTIMKDEADSIEWAKVNIITGLNGVGKSFYLNNISGLLKTAENNEIKVIDEKIFNSFNEMGSVYYNGNYAQSFADINDYNYQFDPLGIQELANQGFIKINGKCQTSKISIINIGNEILRQVNNKYVD